MRLIDADLLLAVVETGRRNFPIPDNEGVLRKYLDWDGVKYLIERAPTIDAAPVVHARWSKPFIGGYDGLHAVYYRTCSNCSSEALDLYYRYCPKCGAKMDGGDIK